jgi:hypothetical protein
MSPCKTFNLMSKPGSIPNGSGHTGENSANIE